jgi:hypothetical protein
MILIGFSIANILLVTLSVTLGILILYIVYKKIIAYVSRGEPVMKEYVVLYPVEQNPASNEVTLYFTCEKVKSVEIDLLDENMNPIKQLFQKDCTEGGHIVRFDSKEFENGNYFYCLRSENQKTMKKLEILNEVNN